MNVPSAQSYRETPHTPHATLMPDQGTTPMRRRIDKRTHAAPRLVLTAESEDPSSAARPISRILGKNAVISGASGVANSVAQIEPAVVSAVSSSVPYKGVNSTPASTFYMYHNDKMISNGNQEVMEVQGLTQSTLPGIDHACFQMAVTAITPTTCAVSAGPAWEYARSSRASCARSPML
jgi:hypothetical protein